MKKIFIPIVLASLAVLASCSDDEEGGQKQTSSSLGGNGVVVDVPDGGFTTPRCRVLDIKPRVTDSTTYDFTWSIGDSIISRAGILQFISLDAGDYDVTMQAVNDDGNTVVIDVPISVKREVTEYTPYITSVLDYMPAPGQFVNELPEYTEGDTQEDMNRKVLESIGNNAKGMITLGMYGGYVICGFDHTIVNVPGERDFKVLGNAFYADANPNPDAPVEGGSCEPGIVMVAYDSNRNGVPDDDEWCEIAGSEHRNGTVITGYEITYLKPYPDHEAVTPPEDEQFWNVDAEYVPWVDNQGNDGFLPKNVYHRQDYYPLWVESEELTLTGSLLPSNAVEESGTGRYWVLYAFDWGYADNGLNNDETSDIDIDWAVDADGNNVSLPGVDFIKIYTGVNQHCGWLGETSTEVMGINDLHLLK